LTCNAVVEGVHPRESSIGGGGGGGVKIFTTEDTGDR
jgi:hypothetical protein